MKVKICGLTRPEDIAAVNLYRPDYVGFVLQFPRSRRSLTPEQAQRLRAVLSPGIPAVGVTVNLPLAENAALLERGTVDILQLHGQEDDAIVRQLQARTGKPVWKAFRVRSQADLDAARRSSADLVLLDNGYGTGEAFDWTLVRDIGRPFALAGGLRTDNIQAAARMQPYLMDISSGAETDGVKDADKIRALITQIRSF
ncbi:MAG TPA: phosphoribosylanthranilate isomerase [Candidatus Butyricicoccus stercorigallinarum]|nr:phosphoribosylanthranilate isomerase [Candidatus Butyricicoccus stercorigallinarum]